MKQLGMDVVASVPMINPRDAHGKVLSGTALLVDVREANEWAATGSPIDSCQIALQNPSFVDEVLQAVDNDMDRPIIVCCKSGMRGEKAGQLLVCYVNLISIFRKLKQFTGQPHIQPAKSCLLYTSPSPRDLSTSRMPSSA